ncbi:uncharacterized protein LOC123312108 [Coccinella septempunctata]|uniref:uncharacterized protein LOC123312108 n=1 Tax=Coccinella septempunctata TaxID=41139 RepID=UPI001D089A08|nr:uncharacterized protein LOC123312108 [Coccinella septempunctata]XP_044752276.1 uncharacterized protein LOC123312108 [Coccinella septempunctata]
MDIKKLRSPFKSIYDIYDVLKLWNTFLGVACFSTTEGIDGRKIYFYDKGDNILPAVVSAISFTSFSMVFFQRFYQMDTEVDDLIFKGSYFFICSGAILCRFTFVRRMDRFLNAHTLIEEVDAMLRKRGIDVNYEDSRAMAKTIMKYTFCTTFVIYLNYADQKVAEDTRLDHFIFVFLGISFSIATILMEVAYLSQMAIIIRQRLKQLGIHLVKLRKTRNSKLVEQELQMIATVHLKLCKSWGLSADVLGPAIICLHGVFYLYCFFPLILFDYILPRMKYEMAPMLILLFLIMSKILSLLAKLKEEGNKLKKTVIEFNLDEGINEPIIGKMCKTLLLQMEHIEISNVFNGFFVVDAEALLAGIKSCSTYMMFFLQLNNSNMF